MNIYTLINKVNPIVQVEEQHPNTFGRVLYEYEFIVKENVILLRGKNLVEYIGSWKTGYALQCFDSSLTKETVETLIGLGFSQKH